MKWLRWVLLWALVGLSGVSRGESLCHEISQVLEEGDLVFTGITNPAMDAVSVATSTWANHLGIAFKEDDQWMIYESILKSTSSRTLCSYLSRAKTGKVEVRRLADGLNRDDILNVKDVIIGELGTAYDLRFDLHSEGQYCSKLIYQAFLKALGIEVGEVQTLRQVYNIASKNGRRWVRFWFWQGIPWEQETVTPRSQLLDPKLETIWSWKD